MENVAIKRRRSKFSLKNIVLLTILLLLVCSILITIFYTIPQVTTYITQQWYISPLASGNAFLHTDADITKKQVKTELKEAGFQVEKIDENGESITIILDTKEKIILSKKKSLDSQIASLQRISSRFTIEGKHFVSLDLRFDRPVLVSK